MRPFHAEQHPWPPRSQPQRQTSAFVRILAVALLGVMMLLAAISASAVHAVAAQAPERVTSLVQREPAVPLDAPGAVVQVGLHVRNIYDLSLVDQSFLAEGWYWYEWGADVQALLERLRISPDDLIELANEIELGQYDSKQTLPSSEELVKVGRFRRSVRFSGKFFLENVPQRYAPFDAQVLSIDLELNPDALAAGPNQVRLEPMNTAAAMVGESVQISGYELDSVSWRRSVVVYPKEVFAPMRYSRISAVFRYGKNEWSVFLKWIFPVLVVMAIVIVSPSIEGVLGDVRLAIPPSALLTLVVMQDVYKSSFPPAPYLTYLDELYVYCYIVCLAIFLLFLVGTNLVARAAEVDRDRVARRVNRIDAVVQLSTLIGFLLVGIVGWYT